jgi:hypothetical protein
LTAKQQTNYLFVNATRIKLRNVYYAVNILITILQVKMALIPLMYVEVK